MARAKKNGSGKLEDALATLIQTQALFAQGQVAFQTRVADTDRVNSERFARIEALLLKHNRILEELSEAIREKIGFKGS